MQIVAPMDVALPGSQTHVELIPGFPEPVASRLLHHLELFVPPAGSAELAPVGDEVCDTHANQRKPRIYDVVEEWPLQVRAACLEVSGTCPGRSCASVCAPLSLVPVLSRRLPSRCPHPPPCPAPISPSSPPLSPLCVL